MPTMLTIAMPQLDQPKVKQIKSNLPSLTAAAMDVYKSGNHFLQTVMVEAGGPAWMSIQMFPFLTYTVPVALLVGPMTTAILVTRPTVPPDHQAIVSNIVMMVLMRLT